MTSEISNDSPYPPIEDCIPFKLNLDDEPFIVWGELLSSPGTFAPNQRVKIAVNKCAIEYGDDKRSPNRGFWVSWSWNWQPDDNVWYKLEHPAKEYADYAKKGIEFTYTYLGIYDAILGSDVTTMEEEEEEVVVVMDGLVEPVVKFANQSSIMDLYQEYTNLPIEMKTSRVEMLFDLDWMTEYNLTILDYLDSVLVKSCALYKSILDYNVSVRLIHLLYTASNSMNLLHYFLCRSTLLANLYVILLALLLASRNQIIIVNLRLHKPPSVIVKKQPIYVTHPREGVNNEI
jgi:hypothetical protein